MNNLTISMQQWLKHYQLVRQQTEDLCQPLELEDYVIQSIEDVSPPKWHLAHTTWFFETFILIPHCQGYKPFHPSFHYLFNSYYQSIGSPYPRVQRGLLSRPTVKTIYEYRASVNLALLEYLAGVNEETAQEVMPLVTLGLHHEQQHQELMMMDIKHNFALNPNFPVYSHKESHHHAHRQAQIEFMPMAGGMIEIGHPGDGFNFDNELPRHQQFLKPYSMASRLVTNAEYLAFMEAGGYQDHQWWLSDGWEVVMKNQWQAPLYWHKFANDWHLFTLTGLRSIDPEEPVSHVSFYEADAYARWRGVRLATEIEWEHFVEHKQIPIETGNYLEGKHLHPRAASADDKTHPQQFFGDLWEWTASAYSPYPGYKPLTGALGEYNGKFMSNQLVLRGGSCVTPQSHIRASYRNFFQPDKRWQFSGIRLAKNEEEC